MTDSEVTPTNSPPGSIPPSPPGSVLLSPKTAGHDSSSPKVRIYGDNFEQVSEQLYCPSCTTFLTPPVRLCVTGHCYCNSCADCMTRCLVCFKPMTKTTAPSVEDIVRWLGFPCYSMANGCPARMPVDRVAWHNRYCLYTTMTCPANRLTNVTCPWNGLKKDFRAHVESEHLDRILRSDLFCCRSYDREATVWKFLIVHGDIFMYCKFFALNSWCCFIQSVELTKGSFVGSFEVKGEDGVQCYRLTLEIIGMSDYHRKSYTRIKFFRMPKKAMKHFVVNDQMNLSVYIKNVTKN